MCPPLGGRIAEILQAFQDILFFLGGTCICSSSGAPLSTVPWDSVRWRPEQDSRWENWMTALLWPCIMCISTLANRKVTAVAHWTHTLLSSHSHTSCHLLVSPFWDFLWQWPRWRPAGRNSGGHNTYVRLRCGDVDVDGEAELTRRCCLWCGFPRWTHHGHKLTKPQIHRSIVHSRPVPLPPKRVLPQVNRQFKHVFTLSTRKRLYILL